MNQRRKQTQTEGSACSPGAAASEKPHKERSFPAEHQVYQIRVQGHLDDSWSEWFEGLTILQREDGTTVLTGPVTDQPALHGLLTKIGKLGLLLLSVQRVETGSRATE